MLYTSLFELHIKVQSGSQYHTLISNFQLIKFELTPFEQVLTSPYIYILVCSIYADRATTLLRLFTVRPAMPLRWKDGSFLTSFAGPVMGLNVVGVGHESLVEQSELFEDPDEDREGTIGMVCENVNGGGGRWIASTLLWTSPMSASAFGFERLGSKRRTGMGLDASSSRLFVSAATLSEAVERDWIDRERSNP